MKIKVYNFEEAREEAENMIYKEEEWVIERWHKNKSKNSQGNRKCGRRKNGRSIDGTHYKINQPRDRNRRCE